MNETTLEAHPLESVTLYSGKSSGMKVLVLVVGKRMAVSIDLGSTDPWRNKENLHFPYAYESLNFFEFTDLEKVW